MQLLMLGNGFDLHYCLPTTYKDFLRIDCEKVANLSSQKTEFLRSKVLSNKWILYLKEKSKENGNWVDFEQEIARALSALHELFISYSAGKSQIRVGDNNPCLWGVMKAFDLGKPYASANNGRFEIAQMTFRKDYLKGPKFIQLDKEKIIGMLFSELCDLNKMLRYYLESFAEAPFSQKVKSGNVKKYPIIASADAVVTFNYTNSFETLYGEKKVCHIHGRLPNGHCCQDSDKDVVLGIDSDKYDELGSLDMSFIQFKKYFQRATLCTDSEYRKLIWDIEKCRMDNPDPEKIELRVIGHSLDKTDKEIIQELFELSDEIWVYYYKEKDKVNYNRNLVSIYGMHGFERIRKEKQLTYVALEKLDEMRLIPAGKIDTLDTTRSDG